MKNKKKLIKKKNTILNAFPETPKGCIHVLQFSRDCRRIFLIFSEIWTSNYHLCLYIIHFKLANH